MKLQLLFLSVLILFLVLVTSCEKDEKFFRVTDISINTNNIIVAEGDTLTLNAMIIPSNASNKSLNWKSSNDNIVTIDNNGLLNAKNVGEATITVSSHDGNVSKIINIQVVENWISLSRNIIETSLNGGSYQVKLTASSSWTIVSSPQWVTTSLLSGSATGSDSVELVVDVSLFTGTSLNRSGDVIFKLNNRNYADTLRINQINYQLSDGEYVKIQSSTAGDGIDIVFLGDGYTVADIISGKFEDNLLEAIDHFFDIEPYRTYRNYFDVYIVYARVE